MEKIMPALARRSALTMLAFAFCAAGAVAQGWQHFGAVQRVENLKDGVEVTAARANVRLPGFNGTIVRVRVAPQGNFQKDSSWAVIAAPQSPTVKVEDSKNELKVTAGNITVLVQKSPLLIRFADTTGHVLLADEPSLPMAFDGPRVHVWKKMPADANYYVLGDKTGPMNRRNRPFPMLNSDVFCCGVPHDPMYTPIPFFMGL